MAKLYEHEIDCTKLLGNPYTYIHKWLDQYAEKYPVKIFGEQHRQYLHNDKGLDEIKRIWGKGALEAGAIHIIRDLVGYVPKVFNIGRYHYGEEEWIYVDDEMKMPDHGRLIRVSNGALEIEITYLKNVGLSPEIVKWKYVGK